MFISPEAIGLKTEAVQGKHGRGRPGAVPFAKTCRKNFFSCFNTQYSAVAIKEQNGGQENKQEIQEEKLQVKTLNSRTPHPRAPALPQSGSVAKALGLVGETGLIPPEWHVPMAM